MLYQSKGNRSLEKLNLMMNGLNNQGAILIGNMLSNNETLIALDISNNRIEKDGADIFASKLELNRRLKKLWVRIYNIFI
jgi:Ran GTPase-activating protein (RanGAP) involved in mRNA processing and transport